MNIEQKFVIMVTRYLRELIVLGFRNLDQVRLEPGEGLNLVVGENAQGKTSLVEAVYMLATGRSPRAAKDMEMINRHREQALIKARVRSGSREISLEVVLRRTLPASKEFRLNGGKVSRGELLGQLPVVLAWSHDQVVIQGPPVLRRRLLDDALVQISPTYYAALARYGRALQHRNRLLKKAVLNGLEAWDEQIIGHGVTITAKRHRYVAHLAPRVSRIYEELTDGREALEVHYHPSWQGTDEREIGESARKALIQWRPLERQRGLTLVGPHRDEVTFLVDGLDLRSYGSRGQQVTAALAWRFGEWEVFRQEFGGEPLLLLDDVLADLDPRRQRDLLCRISEGPQALVTATAPPPLQPVAGVKVFSVAEGVVRPWAEEGIRR